MPVRLPAAVRRLIAGVGVSSVGTGLVLPYNLIYLHEVRHIPLVTTGFLLAAVAVGGFACVPPAGILMDRFGAGRVLQWLLVGQAAAEVGLAFAHTPGQALAPLVLFGAGIAPAYQAQGIMFVRLTGDVEQQKRAFAVNFTVLNAAIGVGGLVAALVVDVHHAVTFQAMFFGNALACLLLTAVIRTLPSSARHAPRRDPGETAAPGRGYRSLLREPLFRRMLLVNLLVALTGYAAVDSGLPAYSRVLTHVSPRVVGFAITANTLAIVLTQIPMLRVLRGRRRTRALAGVGVVWAVSWALFGVSALVPGHAARAADVLAFCVVFGLGETLLSPTMQPLVNALADEATRGRYNALTGVMYSVAFAVAPALSGGLIGVGAGGIWIGLLVAGSLGVTLLARRMEPLLSAAQNGIDDLPVPDPAEAMVV